MGGNLKTKQKVTLTLDSKVYAATRELLVDLPGKPSVSSLVDELLGGFVVSMGPIFREMLSGDTAAQVAALKRFHGETSTTLGLELAGTVRAIEAKAKKGESST